eukprot:764258-Hanusia_phi.AAC.3
MSLHVLGCRLDGVVSVARGIGEVVHAAQHQWPAGPQLDKVGGARHRPRAPQPDGAVLHGTRPLPAPGEQREPARDGEEQPVVLPVRLPAGAAGQVHREPLSSCINQPVSVGTCTSEHSGSLSAAVCAHQDAGCTSDLDWLLSPLRCQETLHRAEAVCYQSNGVLRQSLQDLGGGLLVADLRALADGTVDNLLPACSSSTSISVLEIEVLC